MIPSEIRRLAHHLTDVLGSTLVSTLAGSTDTRAAAGWGHADGSAPNTEAILRLECAEDAWRKISGAEGDDVARAWFVGGNPWLHGDTAITAIREGRFDEVAIATRAYLEDSFTG